MPKPRASVKIKGALREVRRARFEIQVLSEIWDASINSHRYAPDRAEVIYDLEVDVDERSGGDGAPAPHIQSMPVLRAAGGRHPSLEELGTLMVDEADDDSHDWDAWFGNDAPELSGNRVRFLGWKGNALRVRWEAHYEDRGRRRPFLFEGLVDFTGVHVSVRSARDADVFVKRAWGGQPLKTLDRHVLGWTDRGDDVSADRRFSFSVVYSRKGAPLSDQYHVGARTKAAAAAERKADSARFEAAAVLRETAPAPWLEPGPPKRVFDALKSFSIEAPWDWEATPPDGDPLVTKLGGISLRRGAPVNETFKAMTFEMKAADTIGEYVDTSLGAWASIWKVEDRGAVELSGAKAERFVIEQTIGPSTTRLLKYFVAALGKKVIVMTFMASPKAFLARLTSYDAIARTLVIALPSNRAAKSRAGR